MKTFNFMMLMAAAVAALIFGSSQMTLANEMGDEITVVSREAGSGTRGAFTELVGLVGEDGADLTTVEAVIYDGTGQVMTDVQKNLQAVGYISLGSLNDSVKAVAVDGVAPSIENIKSGSYKIARPFIITYAKDEKNPLLDDFVAYILSSNGQALAQKTGFIAVSENPSFKSAQPEGTLIIGGSTSVSPLMEKLVEDYKTNNPEAEISIESVGSTAGIKGSINGTFDIGMSSRSLKDVEKKAVQHQEIAADGIVIIVNPKNPLSNLTSQEILGIYNGTITKFSNLSDMKK